MWIVAVILVLLAALSLADSRNRSNLPTRSWNVWIGPKPQAGESRARFTLRRAFAALLTLAVVAAPLFFVSAPPDEGTSFIGDESTRNFVVFLICAPLAAMAFISLCALLFSALVSAILRSDETFDEVTGEFTSR